MAASKSIHHVYRGGWPITTGWTARADPRPRTSPVVILEHAVLHVRPGEEGAFESAFRLATPIIATSSGFRSLRLARCNERPSCYVLLVEWDRLEDHVDGFRGSPRYDEWRRLLHHFYDPFPDVEHFEDVLTAGPVVGEG